MMKGHAVLFPEGVKEAIKYYEEVLQLIEKRGDKPAYANQLKFLGVHYSNMGDKESAKGAYKKALDIFEKLEDAAGQGECLLWLGFQAADDYHASEAQSCLEKALPLFQASGRKDWEAVCVSGLQVLQEVGTNPGIERLLRYSAVSEILKEEEGVITYAGEPGFGAGNNSYPLERALKISVFYSASKMSEFVNPSRKVGDVWSANVFSYTFNPLLATAEIVSNTECITVPAGTFENCLRIRVTTPFNEKDNASENGKRLNKIICGKEDIWYAPGVGIVRITVERADNVKADLQLKRYFINGESDGYLPLNIGNEWEYTIVDQDPRFVYKEVYRVLSTEEQAKLHFLSHYDYVYFTGDWEDYNAYLAEKRVKESNY